MQSLQAELAAAEKEKQDLLQQAGAALKPAVASYDFPAGSEGKHDTHFSKDQLVVPDSLPPKVPRDLHRPKQPPLRSLSWGSSQQSSSKHPQQPQWRSTFNLVHASDDSTRPPLQQQPLQLQSREQHGLQEWLCQKPTSAAPADSVDVHAVKQKVLQEVLQATALTGGVIRRMDLNNLTVQVSAPPAGAMLCSMLTQLHLYALARFSRKMQAFRVVACVSGCC